MAYYGVDEMKSILSDYAQYRDKLYCRGFLITDRVDIPMDEYPFYGNWDTKCIAVDDENSLYIICHRQTKSYIYNDGNAVHFIIGHAYNPYQMESDEEVILDGLSKALRNSIYEYWEKESELTGVFCVGFIRNNQITFSTDCAGMQLVYYGKDKENFFISSHSKLVADLCGFLQDEYITRLVNSRFYKYWGTFLPGDRSPFRELKRVVPNFSYRYRFGKKSFSFKRFFPNSAIDEVEECEYESVIQDIGEILENSMELIMKKWPGRKAAISVTGGRDSTTTLAAANKYYNGFQYFSYISNDAEKADAIAAHEICDYLDLNHKIYMIPDESKLYQDIDILKKIFECNAGCIGHNNLNDVKKRIYLDTINDFDVEVKSWVDELSRGEAQNKYNTRKFPERPTPGYYRCMWKVIVDPFLIRESNKIFKSYLDKYYDEETLSYLPWTDYFFWEFSWSSGEGTFLTSEHKYSSDITIPYNNRKLLRTMFTVPLNKRLDSCIQKDLIHLLDKRIEEANIVVKNLAHTELWSFIIRTYMRVFSFF